MTDLVICDRCDKMEECKQLSGEWFCENCRETMLDKYAYELPPTVPFNRSTAPKKTRARKN